MMGKGGGSIMHGQTRMYTYLFIATIFSLLLTLSIIPLPFGGSGGTAVADPGAGWEQQATPVADGEITAVSAADATTAWAAFGPPASPGSKVLRTQNGGADWYVFSLDDVGLATTDVYAVNESVVWAIGSGSIFKSIDGGGTWSKVYQSYGTPTGSNIAMDVCAGEGSDAWAVVWLRVFYGSAYGCSLIRTLDGGSTWNDVLFFDAPPIPYDCFSSIDKVDDSTIWVSLYGSLSTVLRSLDGGANWEIHELDNWIIHDICAIDASTAWAVGDDISVDPGTGSGVILRTDDGGATWQEQYRAEGHTLSSISAVDASTVWAVGDLNIPFQYPNVADAGVILKTSDAGATWAVQHEFSGGGYLSSISAVDATTAWAAGKSPSGSPLILKTTDGGDARPDIVSISPSPAPWGYELTVSGCDFGMEQGSSYVSFGDKQASEYTHWSDTEIRVRVPGDIGEEVMVTVTTSEGTSNPTAFSSMGELSVYSVDPGQAVQYTLALNLNLNGNGFMPGVVVRLEKEGHVIEAFTTSVNSSEELVSAFSLFGAEPGSYDVVVTNPGGAEARLEDAFTVSSLCGAGSGTTLLMLGLALGLLSLAGTAGVRRRRETRTGG